MGCRQIGQSEDVEGTGGDTVRIGRFVSMEIGGPDFADGSRGGGELVWEVGGVEVGGGDEVVVLEAEEERATVFV